MLGVTVVDVVGRYFLNAPIPGSDEMVSFGLALTIFAGLPLITHSREHISLSLLHDRVGGWAGFVLSKLIDLLCLGVCVLIFTQLIERAEYLRDTGELTSTLRVHLWPIPIIMAVFIAAMAGALLLLLFRRIGSSNDARER